MSNWIDASWQKPTDDEEVWVFANFIVTGKPDWHVTTAYYRSDDDIWRDGDCTSCQVTHWQPVNKPEPPLH